MWNPRCGEFGAPTSATYLILSRDFWRHLYVISDLTSNPPKGFRVSREGLSYIKGVLTVLERFLWHLIRKDSVGFDVICRILVQTSNPKPSTLSPKRYTLNPEPFNFPQK